MKAVNETNGFVLAEQVERADTFWARLKGLLGRKELAAGRGLLLTPCNSIHMFFMKFAIDAVFISCEGEVLHVLENFKPWRISRVVFGARSTLELPSGVLQGRVKRGDKIKFE